MQRKRRVPGGAQIGKRLLYAVIDDSFEKTVGRIPAAIDFDRLLWITFAVERLGETSAQRRPDDPIQFRGRRRDSP